MDKWVSVTLTCAVLCVSADANAGKIPPVPDNPIQAQTSLGYSTRKSCPDLRISDEGTLAVVVFWLPSSGIPAQISIRTSSGSSALDSAAMSCAAKLRFAAATRVGDGEAIDSWQQVGFRWVETRASTSGASQPSEPVPNSPPPVISDAKRSDSGAQPNSVTVHVCTDETGKLKQEPTIVHSSGKASVDQAAVHIAASGSPYYRPDNSPSGPPVSGCAQLTIRFETRSLSDQ